MKGDLISREALKKDIEENSIVLGGVQAIEVDCAKALIDNAPTVKFSLMPADETKEDAYKRGYERGKIAGILKANTRQQGEWIPVSERLPEQANQSYLVTVDYGNGLTCSCQRFFFSENIGWNDDCVIAWQPLPKPYEKGGAE